MSTGLVYSERFLDHVTAPGHPERRERLVAIVERLKRDGTWDALVHLPFEPVTRDALERLHTPDYLDRLHETCAAGAAYIDEADSSICEESEAVALLAAGGVLAACDAVMAGVVRNAFCAVRPPGHHAEHDRSMGFCLYANAALAADHLIRTHGLERVAVVDFDVHHGNGTQHLLEARRDVLFVSLHEDPMVQYPGTGFSTECGVGEGEGFTVNVPMPPGAGDDAFAQKFEQQVIPALDGYRPQFVLLSAGFDAASADPLGGLDVSTAGFAAMTRELVGVADRHADGRLVSVLEGGYHLDALADAVSAHVMCLRGG